MTTLTSAPSASRLRPILRPDLVQGTATWLAWRRWAVTASDVPALLGLCPADWNVSADTVLREKVSGEPRPSTFAMRRGQILEPRARDRATARLGKRFVPVCVEHPEARWARASLDGLSPDGLEVLEVKAPNEQVHDLALSGFVPDYYLAQVQWELFVACCDVGWFGSLSENVAFPERHRFALVRVEACPEWQGRILDVAEPFLARLEAERARISDMGGLA